MNYLSLARKITEVTCPHCGQESEVEAVNCGIYRCGHYYDNGELLNPHLSKEECDKLYSIKSKDDINRKVLLNGIDMRKIYGCAKPFKTVIKDGVLKTEICGYI